MDRATFTYAQGTGYFSGEGCRPIGKVTLEQPDRCHDENHETKPMLFGGDYVCPVCLTRWPRVEPLPKVSG